MKHLLALLLLYCGFALLVWHRIPSWPYLYDEADYMFAASLGLRANYTDTPTMPIAEFVHTGLTRGRQAGSRSFLSQTIRASDDIVFYRHWHGPLYFYWLLAVSPFHADPQLMRGLQMIFPAFGALLIYFGCLRVFSMPGAYEAAVLSTALYLWSEAVVRSPELAPHQLFALCSLASLFLMAQTMRSGERRWWYGAVAFAALAACTLEVAFVLVITLMICGHLRRRELGANLSFAAKTVGIFVAVILLIWPGAILKLSFVKAYAFMAYLALFRSHAWGTNMTIGQVWWMRFAHSPVEWLLVAAGIVSCVLLYRRKMGQAAAPDRGDGIAPVLPFAFFAALMIAAVFRVNGDAARYMLPFMPALEVVAGASLGLLLARVSAQRRAAVTTLLCLLLFCSRWYSVASRPIAMGGGHELEVLTWVRSNHLERERLLAPQDEVPMLHYYFPNTALGGYTDQASLDTERAQGHFAAVLYPGDPLRFELSHQP